jgi:hypothetical protein
LIFKKDCFGINHSFIFGMDNVLVSQALADCGDDEQLRKEAYLATG